jgi:hypothetical protein
MKNNILKCVWLIICLLSLTLLTSCGGGGLKRVRPHTPTPTPILSGPLVPPSNVTVVRVEGGLRVSWSEVPGASYYQLKRKDGDGSFAIIPYPSYQIHELFYIDTDYPKDKSVQYAVIAVNQIEFSTLSEPTNPICEQVQGVTASLLKYSNKIALNWSLHPENPTQYKIYRSELENDFNYDLPLQVQETNNTYSDQTAEAGVLYYYKITWVKDGVEYGKDAVPVYGVRNNEADDIFEPNDNIRNATLLTKQTNGITAYTFAIDNHTGGYKVDTDWYVYQREDINNSEMLPIEIGLVTESFDGKIKLRFAETPDGEGNTILVGKNPVVCKFPAGFDLVYFKIEPESINSDLGIAKYTITLY